MVGLLAVIAAGVATVFAQATSVRFHQRRQPHELAWTIALVMFALASVALFLGDSTGWDGGTYRAFYLLGAILNVPWLALGTIYLLAERRIADRIRTALIFFSGMALGSMLSSPVHGTLPADAIPRGREHLDTLPRILAGVGSGLGATVLLIGAVVSARRWSRRRDELGASRLALSNLFIALGTLVLSSGGLVKGWVAIDADEAFALCTAIGISVIYAGFWTASARADSRSARRRTLPANV
jgi:hypothetical protein